MINTILFDLDGTLLRITQEAFISDYFGRLKKVFAAMGLDAGMAVSGVWAGTKAMVENDGSKLNCECFWDAFAVFMKLGDETLKEVENRCDSFYANEFDAVREIMEPTDIPGRMIPALRDMGKTVALATNPLFPECAVITRLRWLGLGPGDFSLITHYANSRYCKPNPEYYRDVLAKLGKEPGECIMVGNNTNEDMSAASLGIDTYLVTDFLENEPGADISKYRCGTLAEAEEYLIKRCKNKEP